MAQRGPFVCDHSRTWENSRRHDRAARAAAHTATTEVSGSKSFLKTARESAVSVPKRESQYRVSVLANFSVMYHIERMQVMARPFRICNSRAQDELAQVCRSRPMLHPRRTSGSSSRCPMVYSG